MLNGKAHPKGRPKQGRGGNKAGGEGRRNLDDQQILSILLPSILTAPPSSAQPQLKGLERKPPEKTFFILKVKGVKVGRFLESLKKIQGLDR
ncbi:hypothetical protein CW711_02345 [Candidatus Bathyarchaeota archaeon]|nr:MAG: hypothetical protein CW711_02345 [Candidatus Bathyarchaeota archaeon]